MAFTLLQVAFGAALILVGVVLGIVAFLLWVAGTHSEKSQFAGEFAMWGGGFFILGLLVIAAH